jgi:putative ATP-binding cassette transporter
VYLLIAALVFALPLLVVVEPEQRRRTVTALLFAVGSIAMLVQAMPQLAAADAAAANLVRLAKRLPPEPAGAALLPSPGPAPVELRGVSFAWRDPAMGAALFQVGPVELALRPGEVVFVTGGNGSGKSTLLRLVTGLLVPEAGTILLGGEAVADANRQSYRDRVGAILGDLHLFRRSYGVAADPARVAALLEEYGLAGKVRLGPDRAWEGERALSGGQRKRLAMVALLLEDSRIMVLDEWAADQDPSFRRRFYEEILPGFRAEGRAVLCATHDDRYFSAADRCFRMHDGHLSPMLKAREGDGV